MKNPYEFGTAEYHLFSLKESAEGRRRAFYADVEIYRQKADSASTEAESLKRALEILDKENKK